VLDGSQTGEDRPKPKSKPRRRLLRLTDGRTSEAQLIARVTAELTEHVGGKPTASQRMLIERAAMLSLQVFLMDKQGIRDGGLNPHNTNAYLAWSNSLVRTLSLLGLDAAPDGGDPLAAIHAQYGRQDTA
jgi:hypothetical protein